MIGDKSGKRFALEVIPLTADANPDIRAAAFKALAGVVGPNDVPRSCAARSAAGRPEDQRGRGDSVPVADVQRAVVAATSQITPEDASARPVLETMKTAPAP